MLSAIDFFNGNDLDGKAVSYGIVTHPSLFIIQFYYWLNFLGMEKAAEICEIPLVMLIRRNTSIVFVSFKHI